MKKVLITALFAAGAIWQCRADKIITTSKGNPGPDGLYKAVVEDHHDDSHVLSCQNPGDKACQWATSPWSVTRLNEIEQMVTSQIESAGLYTGRMDVGDAIVSWEATSVTDRTVTVNVKP